MISMDFVNQMSHTHNQAVKALKAGFEPGITFDQLLAKSDKFIDENTDLGVFKRRLQKFLRQRTTDEAVKVTKRSFDEGRISQERYAKTMKNIKMAADRIGTVLR